MKRFAKRTLAMFLCFIMIFSMGIVSGIIPASVAEAAEGTSKIDSYADLVALYGTNVGDDGLVDGFVYVGTEYYEADGELTDYYVQPGDRLTVRLYVKSNMYCGDGILVSLYDKNFFDVKELVDGSSKNATTGYCQNFKTDKVVNKSHPMVERNAVVCTMTSQAINTIGWIKQLCGFDAAFMVNTDLVQCAPTTNVSVSTLPYEFTSDDWYLTYYVDVKAGLADGTVGEVSSPEVLWPTTINTTTNKHDQRRKSYMPCSEKTAYVAEGKTLITDCLTMANALDAGQCDYVIKDDMNHTFTIGEPPAGGSGDAPSTEGVSKIDSYADLVALYGTNVGDDGLIDGFVYVGTEYYEADGKLTDYYVQPGDRITARLYVKSNMYCGDGILVSLYDKNFFDVKELVDGSSKNATTGYCQNFKTDKVVNKSHPMVARNAVVCTMTSQAINTIGWIKQLCGFDATFMANTDLVQCAPTTNVSVSTLPYEFTSDDWYLTYYVDVKEGLADGTVGEVSSPEVLWPTTINTTTNKHDQRRKSYMPCSEKTAYVAEGKVLITDCLTMANALDCGQCDYVIKDDMNHTFIIGNPPAGGTTYAASFKVDGEVVSTANYAAGAEIAAPADAPVKEGYSFLGWAVEGTETILTFPQTMGNAAVTYVAVFKAVPTYTATFIVDGKLHGEVKSYAEGALVAKPAEDPTKDGYRFISWVSEDSEEPGGIVTFPDTMPGHPIVYEAYFEKTHTATFKADGEVVGEVKEYLPGETIDVPNAPSKTGYTFTNWTPAIDAMGDSNVEYNAVYAANTYKAYFYADKTAETAYDSTDVKFDGAYTLPADAPSKKGHAFEKWVDANGNDVPATHTVDGNVSFYATWKANTYDAVFMNDGAEHAVVPTVFGEAIVAPEAPNKANYDFKGWTPEVGNMTEEGMTFTATWEPKTFKVTVDPANGEATYALDYKYLSVINESDLTVPSATGKAFKGWADADGNAVTFPVTVGSEPITLVATWEDILYTVTWIVDGKSSTIQQKYGETIVEPVAPSKEGYTFAGWTPAVADSMPAHNDLVYTATFTVNSYGVTVDPANGDATYTITRDYGSEIEEADLAVPEYIGKDFAGWVDADGNAVVFPVKVGIAPITFVATWKDILYTVTWNVDGVKTTSQLKYTEAIVEPTAPTKEGYTFAGWTPAVPDTMPAGNLEFIATWDAISYDITIDPANGEATYTLAYDYDSEIAEADIAVPALTGYSFAGWADESGALVTFPVTVKGEATLTATYTKNSYNAVFNANGGTFADGSSAVTVSTEFEAAVVAPEAPAKTGYSFKGWDAEIPTSMPAENITINAVWEANTYTVTWDVDGDKTTVNVKFGEAIAKPADPVKDGFVFEGWDAAIPATMPANDLVFTATWRETATEIVITGEDGNEFKIPQDIHYMETVTLKVDTSELPEGAYIVWTVEGEGVSLEISADTSTCIVTSTESGNAVVTATIYDANDKPILNSRGLEITDSVKFVSDACFFWRIVHFFKCFFSFKWFTDLFSIAF